MITRSYQITRVVHRSRISERKSIRSILRMTSDRTCLVRSFALSPGDRPANPVEPVAPASSFLTFPLRAYRPCSHMPAMQTRSNDSTARVPVMQTGRKQEGQQTTQSTPREQASLVDSGHPPGDSPRNACFSNEPRHLATTPCVFIFWSAEFQRHPPPEPVGFPRGSVDPRPAERYSNPVGKNLDSTVPNSTRRRSLPTIGFQSPSR